MIDDHQMQAQRVQHARLGEPPEESTAGSERHFDEDARTTDGDPMPLAGQHPRVRDVDVQTWRKGQQHHAQLVALASKVFAGQPVSEFVKDLGYCDGDSEPDQALASEKGVEVR